jgi:hypothetical protein
MPLEIFSAPSATRRRRLPGRLFVSTEAPVWPAALVRVRLRGAERYALVVHQRHVPPRLRALLAGGIGLRWVRSTRSD